MAGQIRCTGQLFVYDENVEDRLVVKSQETHSVIIDSTHFAQGACRYAYKCRMPTLDPIKQYVAKKYFKPGCNVEQEFLNDFIQAQISARFARKFNQYGPPKPISYIIPNKILHANGEKYTIEPMLEGQWQKHNNIFGWCESERCTPAAFAHFSWHISSQKMMILDVQGVGDTYTDPAICTTDRRFGFTDFGPQGFEEFFKVHRCNEVCKHIGLDRYPPGQLPPPRGVPKSMSSPAQLVSGLRGAGQPRDLGFSSAASAPRMGATTSYTSPPILPDHGKISSGDLHKHEHNAHCSHDHHGETPSLHPQGSGLLQRSVSDGPGAIRGRSASDKNTDSPVAGGPTTGQAYIRGGLKIQELFGDITTSSDSLAIVCSADLKMKDGLQAVFARAFLKGGNDEIRTQKPTVGGIAYQTRRTRFIYYLIYKQTYPERPKVDDLRESMLSLRRHMVVNDVKRLSIPRSFAAAADGFRWEQVKHLMWEVFDGVECVITVYLSSPGEAATGSLHSSPIPSSRPINPNGVGGSPAAPSSISSPSSSSAADGKNREKKHRSKDPTRSSRDAGRDSRDAVVVEFNPNPSRDNSDRLSGARRNSVY